MRYGRLLRNGAAAWLVCLAAGVLWAEPANEPATEAPGAPQGFTRFVFPAQQPVADWAGSFLWFHFCHRLQNDAVLFNKEYLTTADMWVGGALEPRLGKPIQQVHREHLLGMKIDDEGYVLTNQHISHALNSGWPFPLWTHAGWNQQQIEANAAGWHFQDNLEGLSSWVYGSMRSPKWAEHVGAKAVAAWETQDLESTGIVQNRWSLKAMGASPTITTLCPLSFEAASAPYLVLRWAPSVGASETAAQPYLEWQREGDADFSPQCRFYFYSSPNPWVEDLKDATIPVYRHPLWQGKITRLRLALAPGQKDAEFAIDSIYTAFDTRHTINNPIYVMASWEYFRWTGDLDFLHSQINCMRTALRYQQTVMGGLQFNCIRNPWPGHDGVPGWYFDENGEKVCTPNHGIGNNYWDLLPFGREDCYASQQYYAATLTMAQAEQMIAEHPEWGIAQGAWAMQPDQLRAHAERVKQTINEKFWNSKTDRFVAAIDKNGHAWDYGFTFVNLENIWYGAASDEHARQIMSWLNGERLVEGDTSQGADIYRWRFGPRATTRRNVEYYAQVWQKPESIAWGGQVQDGGAVLGFTFYDLWARLHVLSADNAWARLMQVYAWEQEVAAQGGYRAYYADGSKGTTLQGGGTAGGLGIDFEFYESSLVPAILVRGFLGLEPTGDRLRMAPNLPAQCPQMGVTDLLYQGVAMDLMAGVDAVSLTLKDAPARPMAIELTGSWHSPQAEGEGPVWALDHPGLYEFERTKP